MIWRWVGIIFALIVALVGGSVLTARGTATDDPHCLVFTDSIHNTGLLDLRTGASLNISTIPERLLQPATQTNQNIREVAPSQDQQYIAYTAFNPQISQLQLFVKNADRPGFSFGTLLPTPLGKLVVATGSPAYNFAWSPDSHWLAYWWQTADQQLFLGIADPTGHAQHVQSFSVQHPDHASIELHGWSAASSYLALTVTDRATGETELMFWSAPELQLVQTLSFPSAPTLALGYWSPVGHRFAYWLLDKVTQDLQVALITPGETPGYFHFPDARLPLASASADLRGPFWSPDGRFIFIEYDLIPGDNSLIPHLQLSLIDTATKVVQPLTDRASNSIFWSDNGQFLYYVQTNNQSGVVRGDLMVFRVAKNRPELIISGLDLNFFDFVTRSILLFKQPSSDTDNIIALWKESGRIATFGGFNSNTLPVIATMNWFADNDWAVFSDASKTKLFLVNVRTGTQKSYNEPNISDVVSSFSLNKQWLSGVKFGPPPILKLVNLADGTERDIPLLQATIGLLPDNTIWSNSGDHVAVVSRNQAYPDRPFNIDLISVADGRVQHIPNVAPIYNSTFATIAFEQCP